MIIFCCFDRFDFHFSFFASAYQACNGARISADLSKNP